MKIELSALLNKREKYQDFSFTVYPEKVEQSAGLPEDIELSDGIKISGRVSDCDGYYTVKATVVAEYDTRCDRCLKELHGATEFEFSRIAVGSSSDAEKIGVEDEELLFVEDGGINFDLELIEETSLELPIYHLCEDDCPGLCSVCGKRLDGSCKCSKEKEIDPRMESFQKILEKLKT